MTNLPDGPAVRVYIDHSAHGSHNPETDHVFDLADAALAEQEAHMAQESAA